MWEGFIARLGGNDHGFYLQHGDAPTDMAAIAAAVETGVSSKMKIAERNNMA
jgi:hypothetical protein